MNWLAAACSIASFRLPTPASKHASAAWCGACSANACWLLIGDRAGRDFVEPAHDKLVMGWPQLGRFLAEDTGYLLQHSLSQAAQNWRRPPRARALTLWDRDPLLPQALTTLMRASRPLPTDKKKTSSRNSQARRRLGREASRPWSWCLSPACLAG